MATAPQAVQGSLPQASAADTALVKSAGELFDVSDSLVPNSAVLRIPVEIDVAVPVRGFRVANLLSLAEGHVLESQWLEGEDMPLGARGAQLAWAEFEVIDEKLAVRITRLA